MKKLYKTICIQLLIVSLLGFSSSVYSAATAPVKKPQVKASANTVNYISVNPIDVVNNPSQYLNKSITFNADFVSYTSLGLDYKPAYKDPQKFIGILIKRPDVADHVIPLSEMKIFLDRETAEKNLDLDLGDKIKISGKVFSNALGDPWVNIEKFTIISKKAKPEVKK